MKAPSEFLIKTPDSLKETLSLLSNEPKKWKPFAGGTDIMVLLENGQLDHSYFLNIDKCEELKSIEISDSEVQIGSLVTFNMIKRHPLLQAEFPNLCEAARQVGSTAIQNRATLGGNIANASPAADSSPALITYRSQIELASTNGIRSIDYKDFHLDYKKCDLQPNEIIQSIRIPRTNYLYEHSFQKVGARNAQAISKIVFSGLVRMDGEFISDLSIAFGSAGPTVIHCQKTQTYLIGKKVKDEIIADARQLLSTEISPKTDLRSTKDYRLLIAQNILEKFLKDHK